MAASLMLQNLAGRNLGLVPLLWIVAVVPALACSYWLFASESVRTARKKTHGT